jgi:hypothetical protein
MILWHNLVYRWQEWRERRRWDAVYPTGWRWR